MFYSTQTGELILARFVVLFLILLPLMVAPSAPAAQSGGVNFAEHVAPIIFNVCASCHRPGEAAPFSLLTYDDVRKRGKLIASVTASRYMPPWHANSDMGSFRDDRRLTDAQIKTIQDWVQAGMPEEDPKKIPAPPKFTPGWQLGTPDLVVRMEEPFDVPAGGPDIFHSFAIRLNLNEDKWVKAIEFRPSSKSSHHALFFLDETGQAVQLDAADPKPGFTGMR